MNLPKSITDSMIDYILEGIKKTLASLWETMTDQNKKDLRDLVGLLVRNLWRYINEPDNRAKLKGELEMSLTSLETMAWTTSHKARRIVKGQVEDVFLSIIRWGTGQAMGAII